MNLKLLFAATLSAMAVLPQAKAQSTLNAMGGSAIIAGKSHEWSVGEISLVNTFTTSTIIVTQGVLQPYGRGTNDVPATSTLASDLKVFPNPSSSVITVQYNAPRDGSITLRLMDLTGKVISEQKVDIKAGMNTPQVDVSTLAAATYMLQVALYNNSTLAEATSFKIQKLQ